MSSSSGISILVRSIDRPSLGRALRSIEAQDGPPIEVVVVAANGPAHRALPARIGRHDLRLVRPDRRLPRSLAANAAMAAARGDLFGFLDDDDWLLPGHCRQLAAALAANPDSRLVHAKAQAVDEGGRVERVLGEPSQQIQLLLLPNLHLSAVLFARSLYDEGLRFDERFDIHGDTDFWAQCSRRTPFTFVDAVVSAWAWRAGESGAGAGANRSAASASEWRLVLDKWRAEDEREAGEVTALLMSAQEALRSRRDGDALAAAVAALRIRPRDFNALNLAGMASLYLGRALAARDYLQAAVRILPGHAGLAQNLALAQRALADEGSGSR